MGGSDDHSALYVAQAFTESAAGSTLEGSWDRSGRGDPARRGKRQPTDVGSQHLRHRDTSSSAII